MVLFLALYKVIMVGRGKGVVDWFTWSLSAQLKAIDIKRYKKIFTFECIFGRKSENSSYRENRYLLRKKPAYIQHFENHLLQPCTGYHWHKQIEYKYLNYATPLSDVLDAD